MQFFYRRLASGDQSIDWGGRLTSQLEEKKGGNDFYMGRNLVRKEWICLPSISSWPSFIFPYLLRLVILIRSFTTRIQYLTYNSQLDISAIPAWEEESPTFSFEIAPTAKSVMRRGSSLQRYQVRKIVIVITYPPLVSWPLPRSSLFI